MSLTAAGLSKTYEEGTKKVEVLSDIHLEVGTGEFVSVIGPNASGKSTLLKIIAGVRDPSDGKVEIGGDIAYMPQDHTLLPWMTVEENLLLPSQVQKSVRSDLTDKIRDLLREFQLDQYVHSYPASLSGGTRQKIALLRAVLQHASLLLLDEPFSSLDALSRLEAQRWLLALLEKRRASTLLVTHDIREALFLSDTIYVLREGCIGERIAVPLPRPRKHAQLQNPEALALEKRLFALLLPAS